MSKTDTHPCFHGVYILVGGDSKEISKIYGKSDDVKCHRGRTKQSKGHSAAEWVERAAILNEGVSFKGKGSPRT